MEASGTRDFQHVSRHNAPLAFEGRGAEEGREGGRDKKRAEIIAGVCESERAAY